MTEPARLRRRAYRLARSDILPIARRSRNDVVYGTWSPGGPQGRQEWILSKIDRLGERSLLTWMDTQVRRLLAGRRDDRI